MGGVVFSLLYEIFELMPQFCKEPPLEKKHSDYAELTAQLSWKDFDSLAIEFGIWQLDSLRDLDNL